MARNFVKASSQELINTVASPVTVAPLTAAGWAYPVGNQSPDSGCIVWFGDKDVIGDYWELRLGDPDASWTFRDGTDRNVITTNSYTQNAWNHAVGIERGDTDHTVILNGDFGGEGNDTTNTASPDNSDSIVIGHEGDSTPANFFDGRLAEIAIWNTDLTDDEVTILSLGYSPLFVRPANLVFYAPLTRTEDRDIIGGMAFTPTGSPTVADHPPIYMPAAKLISIPALADVTRTPTIGAAALAGVPSIMDLGMAPPTMVRE